MLCKLDTTCLEHTLTPTSPDLSEGHSMIEVPAASAARHIKTHGVVRRTWLLLSLSTLRRTEWSVECGSTNDTSSLRCPESNINARAQEALDTSQGEEQSCIRRCQSWLRDISEWQGNVNTAALATVKCGLPHQLFVATSAMRLSKRYWPEKERQNGAEVLGSECVARYVCVR